MEECSGAIRMVAFGVLELPDVHGHQSINQIIAAETKHTEITDLVIAEIKSMGWLLKQQLSKSGSAKLGKYILLGPVGGSAALVVRPKIGEGTLQEVCLAAVNYLDKTHIPDERFYCGPTTKD